MKYTKTGPSREALFDVAAQQAGYFTAQQAKSSGFSSALVAYHARHGTFTRATRGVYRLRDYPSSRQENLFAVWLAIGPEAAISHDSALEVYGLTDLIPDEVHVTVPRGRTVSKRLHGVRVHTTTRPLTGDQIAIRGGLRLTAPARTLVDAAEAGSAPEQIERAIDEAIQRGLTTPEMLHAAAIGASTRVQELLQAAIPGPAVLRYRTAEAFRRAVEARLNRLSSESGRSIMRLRKEVVFDRLLARLLDAPANGWVLKGGLALDYRFGDRARTTRDMDLVRPGSEGAATRALLDAQRVDLDDYFVFSVERVAKLDEIEQGGAVRFHVAVELAGREFDQFVLDVGFDPPSSTDSIVGPDHLRFAGIDPVVAPAIPLSVQIAEKAHAYTRTYGGASRPSTRVKDLVDLNLISLETPIDARALRIDIEATFERRATHHLPDQLPSPPATWRTPYAKLAKEIGIDTDLDAGARRAKAFVDPVLRNRTIAGAWDPSTGSWTTASLRPA
jgi:predicted transcriptional regulator of viral defense system